MQPIPSTWSTRGRPALLTTDQVEALVEERTSGGNTIGVREMKDDVLLGLDLEPTHSAPLSDEAP